MHAVNSTYENSGFIGGAIQILPHRLLIIYKK